MYGRKGKPAQSNRKKARQTRKSKIPMLASDNFHEWQFKMIENFRAYR